MDFKRFGRLNKKRLDNVMSESTIPYDIGRLFPFLTTRPLSMDSRHTISSFKLQIKKYRYCYRLFDSCIAEIKRHGHRGFEDCFEIDNKLYVFTNIDPLDIEMLDCELIYDRDVKIIINKHDEMESDFDIVANVLAELKVRRYPQKDLDNLKDFLYQLQIVPTHYEDIPIEFQNKIEESLFIEFRWRCLLANTNIYTINHYSDLLDKKKSKRLQELDSVDRETQIIKTKVKIEESYSILKSLNRYYPIDSILKYFDRYKAMFEKLEKYRDNNMELSYKYLSSQLSEDENLEEWFVLTDNYQQFEEVLNEKIQDMETILNNYKFLNEEHSNQYKHFFNKHRKILSKWQTQQVMRKYRQELPKLQEDYWSLDMELDIVREYTKLLIEAKEIHNQYLGDNQIANEGYGYYGDGWSNDITDEDSEDYDVVNDIRFEEKWQREQEEEELEDWEQEIKEQLEREEFENED